MMGISKNKEKNGMEKQYRYIRNDIQINFDIPVVLQNLLNDAEEADLRDDGSYDNFAEYIDVLCKNIYADGQMSKEQWRTVVQKYPFPSE